MAKRMQVRKTEKPKKQKPRCPRCTSARILYRLRGQSYYCRRCGWTGTRPDWEAIPA